MMQPSNVDSVIQPTAARMRIVTLDILRGFALLGILLLTISKFALPERFAEAILRDPESLNYKVYFFTTIIFEGKMRALFSMIFGASIILFISNKERAGRSAAGIYYRRMGWLAVFGLIHAHVLLGNVDILFLFGLCGMVLFPFWNVKPAWLLVAALSMSVVQMTMNSHFYNKNRSQRMAYLEVEKIEKRGIPLTDSQNQVKAVWKEKEKDFFTDQAKIDKNIETMRSGYWTMAGKLRDAMIIRQTKYTPFLMIDPLALMFLGMALFQWGFFSRLFDKRIYVWLLIVGYGIGFPLVLYSWINTVKFPDPVTFMDANAYNIGVYIYPVQRMLLVLGHVSLLLLLVRAGIFKLLTASLAAVGKMAFSNYILQTIICSFIFFGYGLGYFARLEYYEVYFIVIACWIFQLTISPIWLKYFRFGPLEWAWRSLSYWQRQPMRVPPADAQYRTLA